jgi:hypothetical protein
MQIILVGLNHRTAPVEVRERVSFRPEQARRAAEELRMRGIMEEAPRLVHRQSERGLRRPTAGRSGIEPRTLGIPQL